MEMNLTEAYIYLLRKVAGSPGCKVENLRLQRIKPEFTRLREIEPFSYLLIDRKVKSILSNYYEPVLSLLERGERVELEGTCVESIHYSRALSRVLEVSFRKARIFPTVYCDFMALSILSQKLGAEYLDLTFRNLRGDAIAPYFKAVLDTLGITELHPSCEKTIERITKMYHDMLTLRVRPRIGHFLKLAAFYLVYVKRMLTREEARALYHYLRYMNNLRMLPHQRWDLGREIHSRIIPRIGSYSLEQ